ncbi:MAG: EamA family transporter [Chloroflexales bacterium]|nr:EamA family transporter [Chloroflexales bacterium]
MLVTILLLTIPAFTGVAGQLLLKYGMTQMGALELSMAAMPAIFWKMATSVYVVGGLAVYVSGIFFWLLALNRVDLSYAYPFASLSYVLIFLSSWLLLKEEISFMRVMGMIVICMGVFLVARS